MTPRCGLLVLVLLSTCSVAFTWPGQGQEKKDTPQPKKSLVAQKLEHAQHVLGAVAQTDYSMVEKHAQALITNSKDLTWQKVRTERYEELGKEYRSELEGLIRAARAKNEEGIALAYVRVSLSCFRCHNHVREIKIAR
jgi:cytochrome c556